MRPATRRRDQGDLRRLKGWEMGEWGGVGEVRKEWLIKWRRKKNVDIRWKRVPNSKAARKDVGRKSIFTRDPPLNALPKKS
jgi:hypothetical protein